MQHPMRVEKANLFHDRKSSQVQQNDVELRQHMDIGQPSPSLDIMFVILINMSSIEKQSLFT
jgi:hypothetical protein